MQVEAVAEVADPRLEQRRNLEEGGQQTGLGLGDVKMAGAAALWFSPWNLPLFLFVACASALGYIAVRALAKGRLDRAERVAFGPFLGVGLWVTFILERSGFATFIPDPAG